MPWHLSDKHPDCSGWAVVKDSDNSVAGCHATKAKAQKQLAALNMNVKEDPMASVATLPPPRDNLFRSVDHAYEVREDDAGTPRLFGHFARFNEWTEIESAFEGHFMERILPGAFKKTFKENRDRIRVLFQHGRDPSIGDKVLGPIEELREDEEGAFYDVPLLDTNYNKELLPGLRKNLYGASFRFRVMKEMFDKNPGESDHNPNGIPERSIQEMHVPEFGPVTFAAYEGATAGIRSITDDVMRDIYREPGEPTPTSEPAVDATPAVSTGFKAFDRYMARRDKHHGISAT